MKRHTVPQVKSEHTQEEPSNLTAELYRVRKNAEQYGILKNYKSFSKQNMIYSIGDVVGLSAEQPGTVRFIGRIMGIWNMIQQHEVQCVDINWYFSKADLPLELRYSYISSTELFLTDVTTSIYASCIVRKLRILSEKEGNEASSIDVEKERVSRAKYSPFTKTLDPSPEEWQRSCVCREPINLELVYVQCEKCEEWLHNQPHCTGLSIEQVNNSESFVCQRCQKSE